MKFSIFKNNQHISLDVVKIGFLRKGFGLMFRTKNTKNLLFDFRKDGKVGIHSWFVFFPFLIVWLNKENKVVGTEIVKPFRNFVSSKKIFRKFIEVPINSKNQEIMDFFDDKEQKFK